MAQTTLLVVSTGGHLREMLELKDRFQPEIGRHRWVTFDTPQSRSALHGEPVDFVRFVGGRDPLNVVRNVAPAEKIIRRHGITRVLSTGSAVTISFFLVARARGIECHFIESAARADGPSTSGKIISRIPGMHLHSQYSGWADSTWSYRGSVFDAYERVEAPAPPEGIKKVVVSLGTYRGFPFQRVVKRLLDILPADVDVLWQTGDTDVSSLGIEGVDTLPEANLLDAMREADVVVAHAGVGTVLAALAIGKCPIVVPRRYALGEHVDDHQIQLAGELARRNLALQVDADTLCIEHLREASRWRVTRKNAVAAFVL